MLFVLILNVLYSYGLRFIKSFCRLFVIFIFCHNTTSMVFCHSFAYLFGHNCIFQCSLKLPKIYINLSIYFVKNFLLILFNI